MKDFLYIFRPFLFVFIIYLWSHSLAYARLKRQMRKKKCC